VGSLPEIGVKVYFPRFSRGSYAGIFSRNIIGLVSASNRWERDGCSDFKNKTAKIAIGKNNPLSLQDCKNYKTQALTKVPKSPSPPRKYNHAYS